MPELSTPLNAALSDILKHNLKSSSTTNSENTELDEREDHVLTRGKDKIKNTIILYSLQKIKILS